MSLLSRETRVASAKLFALLLFIYIAMHGAPIAFSFVSFLGFVIIPFVVLIHRITPQSLIPVSIVYGFFYDIDSGLYFGIGFLLILALYLLYDYTRKLYSQSSYVFTLLNYFSIVALYNIITAYLMFPFNGSYIWGIMLHILADYAVIIVLRILLFRKV